MKFISRIIFYIYHAIFISRAASCRYTPTCSQFFLDAVEKYGSAKGLYLAAKRILSCHPYSKKPIYDSA